MVTNILQLNFTSILKIEISTMKYLWIKSIYLDIKGLIVTDGNLDSNNLIDQRSKSYEYKYLIDFISQVNSTLLYAILLLIFILLVKTIVFVLFPDFVVSLHSALLIDALKLKQKIIFIYQFACWNMIRVHIELTFDFLQINIQCNCLTNHLNTIILMFKNDGKRFSI